MQKGVILKNNYLNQIIFRIDFETILELTGENQESVNKFKTKIIPLFPKHKIFQEKNLNVHVEDNISTSSINTGNFCWIFENDEKTKEITLTPNNLTVSYRKNAYSGFSSLLTEIILLLEALKEYEVNEVQFIGLRYINEINNSKINDNIQKYINSNLLSLPLLNDLKEHDNDLIQLFSKLDFQQDEYDFTLQYGFYNPTINPYFEKHFILDYDCMKKQSTLIDEIANHLKQMNHLIFKKFENSVTEEFIKEAGETYESSD